MGEEIKDKRKIIELVREITDCWNRSVKPGEEGTKAKIQMFEKVEELLKIDVEQVQMDKIVAQLIEKSKLELTKVIMAEEKYSQLDREIREAITKLYQSVDAFKQGKLMWDHVTIQDNVHIPTLVISNAAHQEIDISKGIERLAEDLKKIMKHLEKDV